LAPYTTVLPKPLMPIGDMPIAELLLRRLAKSDVDHATLAVGHLAGLIMAYFAECGDLGLRLDYSLEQESLGTAAPLALVDGLDIGRTDDYEQAQRDYPELRDRLLN